MKNLREIAGDLSRAQLTCDEMCGFVELVIHMRKSAFRAGLRGDDARGAVRDRAEVVARNLITGKERGGIDVLGEIERDREWAIVW